jgi:hypothetical protein
MYALQQDLEGYMYWGSTPNFDMWEVLLGDHRVHANNCFFLLSAREEKNAKYFVTLKQVIEELKPANMNTLLTYLNPRTANSYMSSAQAFLSNFMPVRSKSKLSLIARVAAEYTPYHFEDKQKVEVTAVVCDDIQVKMCSIRIF